MSSYVYDIPEAEDLCIVIGDTYVGAQLNLSESPGTGTFFARLELAKNNVIAFDVTVNTSTEIVISMAEPATRKLKTGRYEWSLLFRDTGGADRTVCRGYATVLDYPTSVV